MVRHVARGRPEAVVVGASCGKGCSGESLGSSGFLTDLLARAASCGHAPRGLGT